MEKKVDGKLQTAYTIQSALLRVRARLNNILKHNRKGPNINMYNTNTYIHTFIQKILDIKYKIIIKLKIRVVVYNF